MAQKRGFPTGLTNAGGGGASLFGALPGCLSDEDDSTGVFFQRGNGHPPCQFHLTGWNLPARNPGKAGQSSNVMVRVRTLLSSNQGALYLTITAGGAAIQQAVTYDPPGDFEVQDRLFRFPNDPAYWSNPALLDVYCEYRLDDLSIGSSGWITHLEMFYGEADGFVDRGATVAYEVSVPGSDAVMDNAAGGANGTTDHATFQPAPSRQTFNYLVRRIPAFTLPAGTQYAGVEFWDVLDENVTGANATALLGMFFAVNNYPASSPDSVTPRASVITLCDLGTPSPTVKYSGRTALVYFGGPGDMIPWGAENGWTTLDPARLLAGNYEFRSQVFLFATTDSGAARPAAINCFDLTVRCFYDNTGPPQAPLMFCDR